MEYELIAPIKPGVSKIETILNNRGISDIYHYLNTSEDDIVNPSKITNIDDGIKMLMKHIQNNDEIYMIVDEDNDGYASSSLFLNYMHRLFPAFVENHITYDVHSHKAHGVEIDSVPPWTSLVIIIDAGSNQFEEHKYFHDNGIDVLVIDHHLVDVPAGYENAIIINNNATYADKENNYPTKSLCGTAMAYKFCCRIDELLKINNAHDYRDMVALTLISDMMDERDFETVELTREGLDSIKNPFFLEMVNKNKSRFTTGITMLNVAFYVVPFINAVSRVGSKEERMLMFEAMLEYKANEQVESTKRGHKGETERLVEQAVRMCSNLKQTKQTNAMTVGYELAEGLIKDNNLLQDKFIIIQFEDNSVDADINGLIANKLMSKYQRPVLVLQKYGDDWAGSARGYEKGGLPSFRDFLIKSNLVNYAEGHDNACGVSIPNANIDALKEYALEELKDINFTPSYKVDFIWDIEKISDNDIYEIADYAYLWGTEVAEPFVALENIKVNSTTLKFLGASGNTLKINVGDISFVKFNLKLGEKIFLDPGEGFYFIDIVGKCSRNEFNGTFSPQILIEDYNIKKRTAYYF